MFLNFLYFFSAFALVTAPNIFGSFTKSGIPIPPRVIISLHPTFSTKFKTSIETDIREKGAEAVLEAIPSDPDAQKALKEGRFMLHVSPHPVTHVDQLMVMPEGAVRESLPVKPSFTETYAGHLAA